MKRQKGGGHVPNFQLRLLVFCNKQGRHLTTLSSDLLVYQQKCQKEKSKPSWFKVLMRLHVCRAALSSSISKIQKYNHMHLRHTQIPGLALKHCYLPFPAPLFQFIRALASRNSTSKGPGAPAYHQHHRTSTSPMVDERWWGHDDTCKAVFHRQVGTLPKVDHSKWLNRTYFWNSLVVFMPHLVSQMMFCCIDV